MKNYMIVFEILSWTVHKCKESFLFVSAEEYIFVNSVCSLEAHSLTECDTAFANHLKQRAIRGGSLNFLLGRGGGGAGGVCLVCVGGGGGGGVQTFFLKGL